ncbi:hypothetical protein ASPCAL13758 [Aspergillus calidoustus]|uniref:ATP-dependent RNA helicase n=1 Tax=Aspergillus calidoustus TaxID=454130 RepID=A0A0U5GE71_ASPCI|nr:hypothetical protein ASPCAL13758 [Aspergillus calidoustus]
MSLRLLSRVASNTSWVTTRVPLAIRQNTSFQTRSFTSLLSIMPPPNKRRKFKNGGKNSANLSSKAAKPDGPEQQAKPVERAAPSPVQASSLEADTPRVPFSSLAGKIDSNVLSAISAMGIETMSTVQHRVMTELPSLRSDCLVRAKTGEGKTIAFLLPVLQSLITGETAVPKGQVSTLIITPTRELAQQIAKTCDQLTSQLARGIECQVAVGGTSRASAFKRFMDRSPAILVATPGRLVDYLNDPEAKEKMSNIQTVILDEADTMLEIGFLERVKEILRYIPPKSTGWQGMCFSATVPAKVKDVVSTVLAPGYTSISTVNENETPTHERVPQYHVVIPYIGDTFTSLTSLLRHEAKSNNKIIVFGVTANMVALFAAAFSQGLVDLPVFQIHSRLTQAARTRVTAQFKEATSGILFASDVVGRGMDFPNVDLVVQVGLPEDGEQYVHRVGRTARAGKDGRAIIMLTQAESYFLRVNPQLPIKPHPELDTIQATVPELASEVDEAMDRVDPAVKARAYSSYIGFFAGSGRLKKLQLDKAGLVQLANEMAIKGFNCPEQPEISMKIVDKMGLKGVPGFIFSNDSAAKPRHPRRKF